MQGLYNCSNFCRGATVGAPRWNVLGRPRRDAPTDIRTLLSYSMPAAIASAWRYRGSELRQTLSNSATGLAMAISPFALIRSSPPPVLPRIANGTLRLEAIASIRLALAASKLMIMRDGDSLKSSWWWASFRQFQIGANRRSIQWMRNNIPTSATASPPSEQSCADCNSPASATRDTHLNCTLTSQIDVWH